MRPTIAFLIVSLLAGSCFASDHETPVAPSHDAHQTVASEPSHDAAPDPEPHPALSSDASWAGGLATFIITLFLLAAGVGALARLSLPEEPPQPDDSHGHDDHDAHADNGHDAHAHAPAHGHH